MVIAVSACLLGTNCKYSGGNNRNEKVLAFLEGHTVIPICPQVMGGLPTPRTPAEIVDGVVTMRDGTVVDIEFRHGAAIALQQVQEAGAEMAILQPRSPSCGIGKVYDGTFTGTLKLGNGVTAELLAANGIRCVTPDELDLL